MGNHTINLKKPLNCLSWQLSGFNNIGIFLIILFSTNSSAQFVNEGDLYLANNSLVTVYDDAINKVEGDFINDGKIYYFKNLYNSGLISFTGPIGGSTFFTGSENQVIETELESEFYNLTINNNTNHSAIFLNGDISITNEMNLLAGIVNNRPFGGTVIFKRNGYYSNASNNSFVNGKVQKVGFDGFKFPIGDNGYLRELTLFSSFDDNSRTEYRYENSSLIHNHSLKAQDIRVINDKEYWNIDILSSTNAIITLSWNPATTPNHITDPLDETALQIVGFNSDTGRWERMYGSVDESQNQITGLIKGSGIYTLARVKVKEDFPSDLIIYNGMSVNNDGKNDIFYIENIEKYPRNSIEIYNRWGALVYETTGYGLTDNWFRGYSEGNITINKGEKLPSGTYFYIIKLKAKHGNTVDKSGYLYIN